MSDLVIVAAALFAGGLVHTAAGFGSALVAMPILSMTLGYAAAAPLQALCSLILSAAILYGTRRGFDFREAAWILGGSIAGVPAGLALGRTLDEGVVTGLLGSLLIVYALWALFLEPRAEDGADAATETPAPAPASLIVGLIAGFLGGAYNTNGPPIVAYGALRRWRKSRFKPIVQSVFLVNAILIAAGHALQGNFTRDVGVCFLAAVPGLAAGMLVGRRIDRLLDPARFRTVLLGLLLVLGASLLLR